MGFGKSWAPGFLLIASIVFLCGCMEGDNRRITETIKTVRGKPEITVVILGDAISMTDPTGGETYGSILRSKLGKFLGTRVSLINSSRPAMTFSQAKRFYQEDVLAFRPDVVFIMLGMVDMHQQGGYVDPFEMAIDEYFDILAKAETLVVVLTLTGYSNGSSEVVNSYNEEIIRQSIIHHFPVVDIGDRMDRQWMKSPEEYQHLFSNDIYLSAEGHEFVADCVMNAVQRAAKRVK